MLGFFVLESFSSAIVHPIPAREGGGDPLNIARTAKVALEHLEI